MILAPTLSLLSSRQAAFKPTDLSGLALWLDATTGLFDATTGGSSVTADNAAVSRWEDQSGNGSHATQSIANNRPLLKTSVRNGRNGLRFDGSNDSMETAAFAHTVPFTIFVVVKSNNADQTQYSRVVEHGQNNGIVIIYDQVSASRLAYQYGSNFITDSTVVAGTGAYILEYFGDDASPNRNLTFRVNASTQTTTTRASTPATPSAFSLSKFGGGSFNSAQDLYEIVYYNRQLTQSERNLVRGYLNGKWSVY